MVLAQKIKQKALELGFDLVGITNALPIDAEQVEILTNWLKSGFAGQMDYMYRNFRKRINPAELLDGAKSVIVVGLNYKPPKAKIKPRDKSVPSAKVANYAQYEDYHLFIKKQLRKLASLLSFIAGKNFRYKICVDSAPLAERTLAVRAGLGFIGKNHMLINPQLGPQIFLAEMVTNLELQTDEPIPCHSPSGVPRTERRKPLALSEFILSEAEVVEGEESIESNATGCTNCNKCINACPTGALRADGQFDAGKCISYLTIEYKGRIPFGLTGKIGDWLFGCDECVLACQYQKDAPVCRNKQFKFYDDRARLNLQEILSLGQADFEAGFADSCIKRLGLERLKTNAKVCLANVISQKHGFRECDYND